MFQVVPVEHIQTLQLSNAQPALLGVQAASTPLTVHHATQQFMSFITMLAIHPAHPAHIRVELSVSIALHPA